MRRWGQKGWNAGAAALGGLLRRNIKRGGEGAAPYSFSYPAMSSLESIRPKMPGTDSRSTPWEARMGMVSLSSSPT